jgi:arylsulfatase A-like enzyme/Ca2+-binding EF-hand superfamily protein
MSQSPPLWFGGGDWILKKSDGEEIKMKKRLFIGGLILIAASSFAARQATSFQQMDKNNDGEATLEEIDAWFLWRAEKYPEKFPYRPNQPAGTLRNLDTNGDGVLSLAEWVEEPSGTESKAATKPASSPKKGSGRGAAAFEQMDTNKDGQATLEEVDAWFKWRAGEYPDKFPYKPNQPKGTVNNLDVNGDGALSLEEWTGEPSGTASQAASKPASSPKKTSKRAAEPFLQMDTDQDGQATLEEVDAWFKWRAEQFPDRFPYKPNQPRGTVNKFDLNGDGVLSLEEWTGEAAETGNDTTSKPAPASKTVSARKPIAPVKQDRGDLPNIIVILTDDHGYADLGANGILDDIKTPNLDTLAVGGARMTDGYVTGPQCVPSRAGLITGRYQQRFGVDDNVSVPIPADEPTIAERLRDAGYATGMVGKWHLTPHHLAKEWMKDNYPEGLAKQGPFPIPWDKVLPHSPIEKGFRDYFWGTMTSYQCNYDLDGNDLPNAPQQVVNREFRVDVQTDAALAFLKRRKDNPFFLYLSYYAPHVPLEATEKYLSRFPGEMPERRRHALAMISAVDDGVGRIVEFLETEGLTDDTIIFYLGDNGAPYKITKPDTPITGRSGPEWDGSLNDPWIGEKGMVSDAGIRVPFIVSWPNVIKPTVFEEPVISLDIGATALAAAGVNTEEGEIDGVNLLPYLASKKSGAPHDALYWRFWGQAAIREGKWKLLSLENGTQMLFDMETEEHEGENLIAEHPEMAEQLQKKLTDWCADMKRPGMPLKYNREQAWYKHYFGIE